VPERFAHGYQVLEDNTGVSYEMNQTYAPGAEGGLSYDDPRLGLTWPLPVTAVSTRDRSHPRLDAIEDELKRRMSVTKIRLAV
jgi:dTDP-4-dehydrorhamnose 3,5-epimerase